MQSTRKITVASVTNTTGSKVVFSAVTTRAELYAENPDIEAMGVNMKAWVKGEPGYELSSGSSTLPEGDFTLYFLVNKNDSGKI